MYVYSYIEIHNTLINPRSIGWWLILLWMKIVFFWIAFKSSEGKRFLIRLIFIRFYVFYPNYEVNEQAAHLWMANERRRPWTYTLPVFKIWSMLSLLYVTRYLCQLLFDL